MTAKECLMMLREIKDVAFATVDEDAGANHRCDACRR